jgi:hypothetical protein
MRFYWNNRSTVQRKALAEMMCHLAQNAEDAGASNVGDGQLLDLLASKGYERNMYVVKEIRGIFRRSLEKGALELGKPVYTIKRDKGRNIRVDLRTATAVEELVAHKALAGGGRGTTYTAVNEWIWRKIREQHPDVLIFPEIFERGSPMPSVLAYIAPYGQTGYGRVRPTMGSSKKGSEDYTRDLVPGYHGFNYIHDSGGDPFMPRVDRVNEICWGEILVSDGWSMGLKQRAILEHYRHANDKLRLVTAFARRFDLIDKKYGHEYLPLPYSVQNAELLSVADLAVHPGANSQLRPHVAYSTDRTEAALLLAWYGWPYSGPTELRGELPGVDLKGSHRHVWDIETGQLLNTPEGRIHVPAAPATMFRALRVVGSDAEPKAAPEGVALAVSFDDGPAPDMGGGMLAEYGQTEAANGASGKALLVQPGNEAASYGLVPSWFAGSAEFDLQVKETGPSPTPLLRMRHHMDTTLWLVVDNGAPALKLETYERKPEAPGYHKSGYAPITVEGEHNKEHQPPRILTASADLPADGRWHRIVVAWEIGQYRVYVDGKRSILLAQPAILRWRRRRNRWWECRCHRFAPGL